MNRRGFIGAIFGGFAAALVAPLLPKTRGLALNPDAFRLAMEPLTNLQRFEIDDTFTIAGRYAVNPITRQPIPETLQRYVVTASVADDDPFVLFWPTIDSPIPSPLDRREIAMTPLQYGHTVAAQRWRDGEWHDIRRTHA